MIRFQRTRAWRSILALCLALGVLGLGSTGCDDESDYCRAYCEESAGCLGCGGSVALDGCISDCVDLSFSQQRKLADCAKSCENIYACSQTAGFIPPTPCNY